MYRNSNIRGVLLLSLLLSWDVNVVLGQTMTDQSTAIYVTSWGEKGERPGQFRDPSGFSVDPSGYLYVADTDNHRIQKLDSLGRFIAEIGGFGWAKEQFDCPVAVSARNGLDVLVADNNNQRIERYDKDLHYLSSFVSQEEWPEHLRFGFPMDVDLSSQGELFCLDGENHRVLKLDVLGNPLLSFGDFDSGEGRLVRPQRLLVTGAGRIYVSDEEQHRIVVFDIHGNYLHHLGEDILDRPSGMAWLFPSTLIVVDGGKRKIILFHSSGAVTGSIDAGTEKEEVLVEPVDVAVWKERIYVLDKKGNCIHVYRRIKPREMDTR